MKIRCLFGLHNPLSCFRYSSSEGKDERDINLDWQGVGAYDTRVIVNEFSLFETIETKYRCADCGRKFWFARIDFNEIKRNAALIEMIKEYWSNH